MDQKRLRELALEGLLAQKDKIEVEIRALKKAFGAFASTITGGEPERKPKRRTSAQRKAQAERMKAYWAERRSKAAKKPKATAKRSRKTSRKSTKPAAQTAQ
jgi:hypothetical protein